MRRFRVAYVFGFAAYPVLFLFGHNVDRAFLSDLLVPMLAVLAATAVVLAIATKVFGGADRAGPVVAVAALLFLSYGQVYTRLDGVSLLGVSVGHDRFLLPLWAVLFGAVALFAIRSRKLVTELSPVLNVVAIVLVSLPLAMTARFAVTSSEGPPVEQEAVAALREVDVGRPDIYYLIFDRYASERTLDQYYDFDNGPMVRFLRERGFRVIDESYANYPKTPHSLAASLNMRYLDDLPVDSHDWKQVQALLRGSTVARTLQELGYTHVFVGSGYRPLCTDPTADVRYSYRSCNEFARLVYTSTALYPFARHLGIETLDTRRQEWHRTRFEFEKVLEVREMDEPTFTFAHFNLPHDPWIFDADGSYIDEQQAGAKTWDEGYLDQLRYANVRIMDVVDELLAGPESERPIVILQSDEGPGPIDWNPNTPEHYDWTRAPQRALDEKFRILNAYYFPGVDYTGLYEGITPVNSFRVILNAYFDGRLDLLPDESHIFPNELEPYRFIDVTDRVRDDEVGR